jgi:glutathione S-transferase
MKPAQPIVLYQFPPALGLPNASPFCLKLETYLRMAGLPYENAFIIDPRRAPKGKLPYIDDGGRKVADSGLAIAYLAATYGDPLDGHLDARARTEGLLVRRMLEESLYWALLYFRWATDSGWQATRRAFFGSLGFPLSLIVPWAARRGTLQQLQAQGTGRHRPEEIAAFGEQDLAALAQLLGERSFLLGEQPSSFDACAYAFVANVLDVPLDTPLKRSALGHANLPSYSKRMRDRYFPPRR